MATNIGLREGISQIAHTTLNRWNLVSHRSSRRRSTTVAHTACTAVRTIAMTPEMKWTSHCMLPGRLG